MALSVKTKVVMSAFGLLLLTAGVLALRFWWYYGYSRGERTGMIRKVSIMGPPFCKYLSGELVLNGTQAGQNPEIWYFSVDDPSDKNPVVQELYKLNKEGTRVTLRYRQDLKSLYRCAPTEYFITGIEK